MLRNGERYSMSRAVLSRAALGYQAKRAALEGGRDKTLLTQKRRAVDIYGRWQSKARTKKIPMSVYFFKRSVLRSMSP